MVNSLFKILSSDAETEEEKNFVSQEDLEEKDRTSLSQKINNNSISNNNNINNNNNNNNIKGDVQVNKGKY